MRKLVDSIALWPKPKPKKPLDPALHLSSKAAQADARAKGRTAAANRKKETANRLLRVDGKEWVLYTLAAELGAPPAKVFKWFRDGHKTMAALRQKAGK